MECAALTSSCSAARCRTSTPARPSTRSASATSGAASSAVGEGVEPRGSAAASRATRSSAAGSARCRGRQHLCADRYEIGIRQRLAGRARRAAGGACAGPCPLPETVGPTRAPWSSPAATRSAPFAAPGLTSGRAAAGAGAGNDRAARRRDRAARGIEVHLLGRGERSRTSHGRSASTHVWTARRCPTCGGTRSSTPPTARSCRRVRARPRGTRARSWLHRPRRLSRA